MREHDLLGDLAGRDVVLVAPHPDDEAIGPGGTLALAARAGARVRVLSLDEEELTRDGVLRRGGRDSVDGTTLSGVSCTLLPPAG